MFGLLSRAFFTHLTKSAFEVGNPRGLRRDGGLIWTGAWIGWTTRPRLSFGLSVCSGPLGPVFDVARFAFSKFSEEGTPFRLICDFRETHYSGVTDFLISIA